MSTSEFQFNLREGLRSDIPTLARILCDAFQDDELSTYTLPHRAEYPSQYYQHYLRVMRQIFVTPAMKFVLAVSSNSIPDDPSSEPQETVLGFVCYGAEPPSRLHDNWSAESNTWANTIDLLLLGLEDLYAKYVTNRVADHAVIDRLEAEKAGDFTPPGAVATAGGAEQAAREVEGVGPLRLQVLATRPEWQRRGVGRRLLRWGMRNARTEGLPVVLAGSLKGKEFYEKDGFVVFREDVVEELRMPCMIWEPDQYKGRWVEWDKKEERWKLRTG